MSARNVIVLGIDGFDPAMVQRGITEGWMPHCRALQERGTLSPLATTNPAQSPVAWASLATGANPGQHGLFDFILRDPATLLPRLSLLSVNTRSVLGKRGARFRPVLGGTPFWTVTSQQGIPTSVYKWPVNFPPAQIRGAALAGLGVPDIRSTLGRYVLFTTTPQTAPDDPKGDIVQLERTGDRYTGMLPGPNAAKTPCVFVRTGRTVTMTVHGTTVALERGVWSGWIPCAFPFVLGARIAGMCRVYLLSAEPELQVYVTSLHADPRRPAFPLSYPDSFAAELARTLGPFHTLGLPEETNGVMDNVLPYEGFRSFIREIQREREALFWHAVGRFRDGVLAFVFDTIDRAQHIFWSTLDADHPLFDPHVAAQYETVIREFYRAMDGIIGRVLEGTDGRTTLLVVSDHGFSTFRRAAHVNSWLREHEFLALRDGAVGEPLLENVDWARTRAYSVGFSSIYLNLEGRESRGIVRAGDANPLLDQLLRQLLAWTDGQTGKPVVHSVCRGSELYAGPLAAQGPDLVIGFNEGYRGSWQTAVGAAPATLLEDNTRKWSGDHLIDPSFVPGTLLCSERLTLRHPTVYDLAPTILTLLGGETSPAWEGTSFV